MLAISADMPPPFVPLLGDWPSIREEKKLPPMNRIRTTTCRMALAIAAVFAASPAWGEGEVTVVGESWQSPQTSETVQAASFAQPISQPTNAEPLRNPSESANAPTQPAFDDDGNEFSEEVSAFESWLDRFGCSRWSIDYRYRALVSSGITSTFGTSDPPPTGYAPLSRLNFPINSSWHGVRIGFDSRTGEPISSG